MDRIVAASATATTIAPSPRHREQIRQGPHFKRVTTLSPLQYQKQLRLQEARRLLLSDAASAADVAFRMGYESPSQFSREYARHFGLPPIADVKRVLAGEPHSRGAAARRAGSR